MNFPREMKVHPALQKPFTALALLLIAAGTGYFFYYLFQSWFWGGLGGLILFLSWRKFFFPTCYLISREGIQIKSRPFLRFYPWKRFKSYKIYPRGIYLSPLADPRRFDRFRGVFLILTEQQKEQMKGILEGAIERKS